MEGYGRELSVAEPLTIERIKPHVALLRQKRPESTVIGFRSPAGWTGPTRFQVGSEEIEIAPCRSVLEIREKLSLRSEASPPLVLVTALDEASLGDDVLARLARRRLHDVQPWEIVREQFRARLLDPRLSKHPWMAEMLLAAIPPGGVAPVPGGVLSLEAVWALLLEHHVVITVARPDARDLLRWTTTADVGRYMALPLEMRAAFTDWVADSAGGAGSLILRCVEAGHGRDGVPLGLVCGVVFDERGIEEVSLAQAAVRMERFVGGEPIHAETGRRWATVAEELLRERFEREGLEGVRRWLGRADELLREVGVADEAHRSNISQLGLEQRLARYASVLAASLSRREVAPVVGEAAKAVLEHMLMRADTERSARLMMSERLARWLVSPPAAPASFAEAALLYARDGSFADWARMSLRGGDASAELSGAYGQLFLEATARSEQQAHAFALLLRGWLEADSRESAALRIEDLLEQVIAPLAKDLPVLLIVLDGMSAAVFNELVADLTARQWVPMRPSGVNEKFLALSAQPVIAAIPTLTEVSRTSLFCGRLTTGGQREEKKGFQQHAALVQASKRSYPPTLFHKASWRTAAKPIWPAGCGPRSRRRKLG
jgi:hypothetical protein